MYSSKDFSKTTATIQTQIPAQIPERLIHRGVEESSLDPAFSRERKHPVFIVDLPSRSVSVTVGHLPERSKTRTHRHAYETILYILEGRGRTFIEEKIVEWKAGDAVYVPVWAWHSHENLEASLCRYLACENTPLLQNLTGGMALREEL